jgi:hypothetical protein
MDKPEIIHDINEDYERLRKARQGGSGGWIATDTPDFTDDDDEDNPDKRAIQAETANMKGLMAVDPDVHEAPQEEVVMQSEFTIPKGATVKEVTVTAFGPGSWLEIFPRSKTFEEFQVGITADSDKDFVITPTSGKMNRKGEDPTEINVKCEKDGAVAYICFVLPEMDFFNEYFKVTCKA